MSKDKDARIAALEAEIAALEAEKFQLTSTLQTTAENLAATGLRHSESQSELSFRYVSDVLNAAQKLAKDVTQYMLHVLEISKTAEEINRVHAGVTGAVVVGGRGEYLEKFLISLDADSALMGHYSRLMGLLEHAPFKAMPFVEDWRDKSRAVGDDILALRSAIQACTMGHDGGAALRRLGLQSDESPFRELIADAQAAIERLGRDRDPVGAYVESALIALMDEQGLKLRAARGRLIERLKDQRQRNYGRLEPKESEALKYLETYSLDTIRKRVQRARREGKNRTE